MRFFGDTLLAVVFAPGLFSAAAFETRAANGTLAMPPKPLVYGH
jgi:hypothetical protein